MSASRSPLISGTPLYFDTDKGYATLEQRVTVQAGGAATADFSLVLPTGAEILDFIMDTTVAHTSNTATISAGSAAGGTQYGTATDVKAGGRFVFTHTLAQVLAMNSISTNRTVYFRLTLTATITSVGTTIVKVRYVYR